MMKATEMIRRGLLFIDRFALPIFEDVRDIALVQPTPRGGNHPLWVIGHIAHSEGEITGMVHGDPNPLNGWEKMFAAGTEPTTAASDYPSFDEVLEGYRTIRARTLKMIDALHDSDLDEAPKAASDEMLEFVPTIGETLMMVVIHQEFHLGQIADVRRTAGRKPLMV